MDFATLNSGYESEDKDDFNIEIDEPKPVKALPKRADESAPPAERQEEQPEEEEPAEEESEEEEPEVSCFERVRTESALSSTRAGIGPRRRTTAQEEGQGQSVVAGRSAVADSTEEIETTSTRWESVPRYRSRRR